MSTRSAYQRQLAQLEEGIAKMAVLVEETYGRARDAVETGTVPSVEGLETVASDIGMREREIETLALRILLLQQPVAGDLREVSGALKMVTDLKRIGDLSLEACRVIEEMGGTVLDVQRSDLADMAALVAEMVATAIASYRERDMKKSRRAVGLDDEVDRYLDDLRTELVQGIYEREIGAEEGVDLLMVAKYLERIGDHAESLAFWTEYVVEGTRGGEPYTAG